MESIEYYRLSQIEKTSWWYRSMHRLILHTLKNLGFQRKRSNITIFDAGCGTGGLTRKLCQFGEVTGLDISPLALSLQKQHPYALIQGSVNVLPFRPRVFHIVTGISVLYHQQVNDKQALGEFYRVLAKGGYVILILPAFTWATGLHDNAVHTKKRYTLVEAKELIERAGFSHINGRYIFSFLFPLFMLKRILERFSRRASKVSDLSNPPWFISIFFELLCKLEWVIGEKARFPFGSSLLITAQK